MAFVPPDARAHTVETAERLEPAAMGDLVFVAFHRHVSALDRYSGAIVWSWKTPHMGQPIVLLDGDRLIVSVNGYLYCLDPVFGQLVWHNPMKGKGLGIASMASVRGGSVSDNGFHDAAAQSAG